MLTTMDTIARMIDTIPMAKLRFDAVISHHPVSPMWSAWASDPEYTDIMKRVAKREVPGGAHSTRHTTSLGDGDILSYQQKRPFEYLRRDPNGALKVQWWAM